MKTTEFKIGNIVFDKINRVDVKVKSLEFGSFSNDCMIYIGGKEKPIYKIGASWELNINHRPEFEFDPIKLTEEWLVKFGFKKYNDNWYNLGILWIDKRDMQCCIGFDEFKQINIRIQSKLVHHLQNLYFPLTGEELEIIIK